MDIAQAALLAEFSVYVYHESPSRPVPDGWHTLDVQGFTPIDDSFFGEVFERIGDEQPPQIVIAFRGSNDTGDWLDANPAIAGVFFDWSNQFKDALQLTDAVRTNPKYKDATILVTGHSLGGSLAQVVAAMFGLSGAAFDPGGAQNVVDSNDFDKLVPQLNEQTTRIPASDFTNYSVVGSLVSHGDDDHVGRIEPLLTPAIFAFLASLPSLALFNPTNFVMSQFLLHSKEGIRDQLVAQANGSVPGFLDALLQEVQTSALTGDFGVSRGVGSEGLATLEGSDESNYLDGNNGANTIDGGAGDDIILSFAGNDTITAGRGNDFVSTSEGNDVIDAGVGSDGVYAGSGDDTITVQTTTGDVDTVSGGAGTDSLMVDTSISEGTIRWNTVDTGGMNLFAEAVSGMAAIQTFLSSATKLGLYTGSMSSGVTFDGIENLSIKASGNNYNDLLIVRGTGSYDGKAGTDTLFADWSTASADITWINAPASVAQTVNGSTITGVERLLLQTGSGNDTISNTTVTTNDEIVTGAGNDTINGGAGDDRIDGGAGNDTLVGGSGNDTLIGSTGSDTVIYTSSRASYTVVIGTSSVTANSGIGTEGSDTLTNVERLQFSDTTLGLDTAMGQASGNSVLLCGAVLGNDLLASKKALVGAVVDLMDQGYSLQVLSGAVMRLPIWGLLANGGQATATNTQIANYLLTTVNRVAPDATTLAAAVTALDNETGAAQGTFLWHLAESANNQTQVNLVGLAVTGIEFGP